MTNAIVGTAGNDSLRGEDTANFYFGLAGDDIIAGGDGSDVLDGGLGNDALYGGRGNDTFVFMSAEQANGDMIKDFSHHEDYYSTGVGGSFSGYSLHNWDKIDISAIDANTTRVGNQDFTAIARNALFTGPGQMRIADYTIPGAPALTGTFLELNTTGGYGSARDVSIRLEGDSVVLSRDIIG